MLVGRGISGPWFLKQNHLPNDFVFLLIIIKYFEISFHYSQLQFVPFSQNLVTKKNWKCYLAKIIEGLHINHAFKTSGDFIPWCVSFKENKAPLCICIYYLICSCSLFVPKLQLRQVKWWPSDLDSWEALFDIHCPVSKDNTTSRSLGTMGAPGPNR